MKLSLKQVCVPSEHDRNDLVQVLQGSGMDDDGNGLARVKVVEGHRVAEAEIPAMELLDAVYSLFPKEFRSTYTLKEML